MGVPMSTRLEECGRRRRQYQGICMRALTSGPTGTSTPGPQVSTSLDSFMEGAYVS